MSQAAGRRIVAVDVARGVALIGMAAYHFTWDLANFGLVAPETPFAPPMRLLSHSVASAFLGLAGVSLALAHADRPRWPAYWRRFGVIAAAAALVSAATYEMDPGTTIWFGILHCIAAASLLAALLLRAPAALAILVGAGLAAAPMLWRSELFNPPALLWLGLGATLPDTLDWRPLMPWAGVMLMGYGVAKAARYWLNHSALAQWRGLAGLAFAGRHSLAIYLIHQPLLFGLLFVVTEATGLADRQIQNNYVATCRPACVEAGGELEACRRACRCVADRVANAGLSKALARPAPDDETRRRIREMVKACGSDAP